MTEFKCDTRSHGNFLYGKKQSVFTVLYRLYNYCYAALGIDLSASIVMLTKTSLLELLPSMTHVRPAPSAFA